MRSILTVLITFLLITSAAVADSDQSEQTLYAAASGVTDRQFSNITDVPDETGRSVALLSVSNSSSAAAVISWASSTPTIGRVEYGPTPDLGLVAEETTRGRLHFVWLTGLPSGQTVYYRIDTGGRSKKVESFQTSEIGAGVPKAVYGNIPTAVETTGDALLVKLTVTGSGGSSVPVSVKTSLSDIWLLNLGNLKTSAGAVFSYSSDMTAEVSIEGLNSDGKPAVLYSYTTDLSDNDLSEQPIAGFSSATKISTPWQYAPKGTTTATDKAANAGPTKERKFLEGLLAKGAQARLDNRKGHGEPFMVPGWRGGNTMKGQSRPPEPGPAPDRIRLRGEVVLEEITEMRRNSSEAANFFPDVARHFKDIPDIMPTDISTTSLEIGVNIFALDVAPYTTVTSYTFLTDVTNATEVTDWDGTLQQFGASAVKIDDVVSGDDFDFELGYGYFVTMTADGDANIDGDPVTSPVYVPLPVGLEVVSLVGQALSYTSFTIFTDLFNGTEICQYNTDLQSYQCAFLVGSTPMGDEFDLEDGSGYFVRSETAGAFPVDTNPPTIAISAPANSDTIYTKQPFIDILYGDPLGGVNQSTFICQVNGSDKSSSFTLDEFGATWQMDGIDELNEGINTIEAWVSDNSDNQASVLSTFMVVTTPPAEDDHFVNGFVFHGDTWEPLEDASVTIDGIDGVIYTDIDGHYVFPTPGLGEYTINITKENHTYAQRYLNVEEGWGDRFIDDAFLNPRDPVSTRITTEDGGVAINSDGSVYTSFPAGAVEEDIDVSATNYDDPEDLPAALPGYSVFTYCTKFWPDRVEFTDSAHVDQLNIHEITSGTPIPIGQYSADSAKWIPEGMAYVSEDDTWFDFGVKYFLSNYDCNMSAISTDPKFKNRDFDPPDKCNNEQLKNSPTLGYVKAKSGSCLAGYSLPSITSFGSNRSLSLTYASHTAKPQVLVDSETEGINEDTLGHCIRQVVTMEIVGKYFAANIACFGEDNMQRIRFDATDPEFEHLTTGVYNLKYGVYNLFPARICETRYFGGIPRRYCYESWNFLIGYGRQHSTNLMIDDRIDSEFGSGWILDGLKRLYLRPDSTAMIATGGAASHYYRRKYQLPVFDLAVVNGSSDANSVGVLINDGDMNFDEMIEYPTGQSADCATAGDFNDDGHEDLAVAHGTSITHGINVFYNDGNGNYMPSVNYELRYSASDIITGDFNNDLLPDLVATIWSSSVDVLLNDGTGAFEDPLTDTLGTGAGCLYLVAADFNEDLFLDIATANYTEQNVTILLGSGDGGFYERIDLPDSAALRDIAVGDFNEDGHQDLATITYGKQFMRVLLGDGTGAFPEENIIDLFAFPERFASGDLNNDGHQDFAVTLSMNNEVLILEGDGFGVFGSHENFNGGGKPGKIITKDLDGDKWLDLAVLDIANDIVSIFHNDRTAGFLARTSFPVGELPVDLVATNINGDMSGEFRSMRGDASRLIFTSDATGFIQLHPDSSKSVFDPDGLHVETIDRNGNATACGYDEFDRLTTVSAPGDLTTVLAYGPDGKLETITDPAERITTFDHDLDGNLVKIIAPDLAETEYEYYADHMLKKVIDPRDYELLYEYDDNGHVNKVTGPDLSTNEYLASNSYSTLNDALADGFGTEENPATPVVGDNVYNVFVNTLGDSTKIYNNQFGRGTLRVDALGRNHRTEYDRNGNVSKITEPNNHKMYFFNDRFGRPYLVVDSSIEAESRIFYDTVFNLPLEITDAEGHITTIERDDRGNPIRIINALGDTTLNFYDSIGQLIKTKDPLGDSVMFVYNDTGRVIQTIDPLEHSTYYEYDEPGNVTAVVDANGKRTEYEYDDMNRVTLSRDAELNETKFCYDDNGNLVALGNAVGDTTRFVYDEYNRMTSQTDTLGFTDQYYYNSEHLLTAAYNPNGDSVTFLYDEVRRLTDKQLPDDTTEYEYNNVDNLLRVEDSDSKIQFDYDAAGRLDYVEVGDAVNPDIIQPYLTIDYTLNKVGGVTQRTDSEGWWLTYGYDDLNRLTSITSGADITTYTFDQAGRPDSVYRSNGSTTAYVFDAASRLTDLTHELNSSVIADFHYAYDDVGIRTGLTDEYGAHTFSYDDIYQLTGATHPQAYNPAESFSYDPLGNRLTSHLSTSYTHDEANRLTEDDDFEYGYDNAGRMIWKRVKATEDTTYFEYTVEDALIRVYNDDIEVQYAYDGAGDRIQTKTITNGGLDTNIVKFSYDGSDLLYEHDEADAVVVKYLYGPGIDNLLETTDQSGTYYHYGDALGSVSKTTDASGTEVKVRVYDSFGNIVYSSGSLLGDQVSFTGREFEEDLGLYYYRARFYDPNIGRFISSDPIGFAAGDLNLYRYVFNSPTTFSDPWGLRIDYGHYKTNNRYVSDNLERLNQAIVDQGYGDDSFTIRVTGGDRFIGPDGVHISVSGDGPIPGSHKRSPHLIERGARAIDFQLEGFGSEKYNDCMMSVFESARETTEFLPANDRPKKVDGEWILKYSDGHIHVALPNTKQYRWHPPMIWEVSPNK